MSKLHPDQNRLWQSPKECVKWDDKVWFQNNKLGKNRIQQLMPTLVKQAKLEDKTHKSLYT